MQHPRTLSEKVWDRHVVRQADGEPDLLYIDLHLVHEVTRPQAFDGLRLAGRGVRRPDLTVATMDHNVPTADIDQPIADPISAKQMEVLAANCAEFGIRLYAMGDPRQGIVHVIGPEQGLTQPGMTIVCGDSHTSTHGAFGALAFGIGTSEVEHVLATQTLPQQPAGDHGRHRRRRAARRRHRQGRRPRHHRRASAPAAASARSSSTAARPSAALSMEGRMTVCNMSIEAGRQGRARSPPTTRRSPTSRAAPTPRPAPTGTRPSTTGARWSPTTAPRSTRRSCSTPPTIRPHVSWGTQPRPRSCRSTGAVPDPDDVRRPVDRGTRPQRALDYMGLDRRHADRDIAVDTVFIGSCTNSRIEDLRAAAAVAEGRQVDGRRAHPRRARLVRGQGARPRPRGSTQVFIAAGFDWREPGCSMCLAMNPDKLAPGERSASTSNRNFEGRQGRGGRTHLVSPAVAAATAIAGHFATPADLS